MGFKFPNNTCNYFQRPNTLNDDDRIKYLIHYIINITENRKSRIIKYL